jgi:hypothetical protein
MTKPSDGIRWIGFDGDLPEMELIGTNLFAIGVAAEADPEFKAYMMAAGSTYAAGNSSVDNTLRKHKSMWVERFERRRRSIGRGQWDSESPYCERSGLDVLAFPTLCSTRALLE